MVMFSSVSWRSELLEWGYQMKLLQFRSFPDGDPVWINPERVGYVWSSTLLHDPTHPCGGKEVPVTQVMVEGKRVNLLDDVETVVSKLKG